MEDNYETKNRLMHLTGREVKDYLRRHSVEQIKGEIDEYISHVEAMCSSMGDLWRESHIPLFICGIHLEVSVFFGGEKIREFQIGSKESLLDNLIKEKIEEFKDGAGECRNPGGDRQGAEARNGRA